MLCCKETHNKLDETTPIVKLDETNYQEWAAHMWVILDSYHLLGHVTGTRPYAPMPILPTSSATPSPVMVDEDKVATYAANDAFAIDTADAEEAY